MIGELTNHLWQSTLFAVAAGLLTAAFRGNKAQVRHCIWFSASLKFLLPFALLMSLGSYLERTPSLQKIAVPVVSESVLQIAEPFSATSSYVPPARRAIDWAPIAFLVWACGFAAMIVIRLRGWLRIRVAVRASNQIDISGSVEIRASPGLLEPGVVGFFRPILLLPAGIVERLTPLQLQAVLAHEMCHIRRRDNLTSAIHMMVEAVFWFHPFVWYIGARMVEERERACDEAVLSLGGEPRDYAEGILGVCKLYVESPLVCVSGVTGANLKRRIEAIITNRTGRRLNRAKKFVLASAGVAVLIGPVALGLMIGIPNSVVRAQAPVVVPAPVNTPSAQAATPPVAEPATPPASGPIQDHRLLALLFDFDTTTSDQQSRARQAALRFVRDQMSASDRVAVMAAEEGKPTVVSDFTDDKTVLESAIQNLNPTAVSGSPLSRIAATVKILGALPGKKALMYFSAPIPRGPDDQAELDRTINAALLANVAIYPIDMSAATGQLIPLAALGGRSMAPQAAPIQTPAPQQDSGAGPEGPNAKLLVFDAASIKPFSGGGGGRNGGLGVNPPRAIGGSLRFPPGRVVSAPAGVTARKVILEAFHLNQYQLSGGPGWLDSDRFELEAKAEGASENQLRQMLKTLLAERFKLVAHRETKEMPVYALMVGRNGPQFHEWKDGDPLPEFGSGSHATTFRDVGTMRRLADVLSAGPDLGRPVLDKTGLKGTYLFYAEWDEGEEFLPALQQQLGLKLESQRGPVDNLVIDHIDKPTAN
jgi:uncharacterized protein (TIGR03435 family)